MLRRNAFWLPMALAALFAASAPAADESFGNVQDLIGKLDGGSNAAYGKELSFSATFKVAQPAAKNSALGGRDGVLFVTATLAKGWHTYSMDQAKGGPTASKLTVQKWEQVSVVGPFKADREPHVTTDSVFPGIDIKEYSDEVIWSAPIMFARNVVFEDLVIPVQYDGMVCVNSVGGAGGSCIPKTNVLISAKYAGELQGDVPVKATEPALTSESGFRPPGAKLLLSGTIDKQTVAPGGKLKLSITATPDPEWFVYAVEAGNFGEGSKPTLIVLSEPGDWRLGAPVASVDPKIKNTGERYHKEPVTWTVELSVPENAAAGKRELAGLLGYQTCKIGLCDPPALAEFRVAVEVGESDKTGSLPLAFTVPGGRGKEAVKYDTVAKLAAEQAARGFDFSKVKVEHDTANMPLYWVLPIALLGGFILNFMPCVLPVIGLKVLSFVQQAGESRARVFALNLWYTLGMLSVFMVLATLAVVWNFGWGELNTNPAFNIPMAAVVFVLGLSFLGVWEIPIPGFVGSGKASELAQKEGLAGAFFKGAITTLLATPCSAPGLGTALVWCNGKPAYLIYLVFLFLGLGMAAPYLVIGLAPKLVKLLPKPGPWMETFKQAMGFVLLGTVIFILTYLPTALIIPTVALLIGLWAACWWIGRTPLTAELPQTIRAWAIGAAMAGAIGWFSLTFLANIMSGRFESTVDREIAQRQTQSRAPKPKSEHELPWQPYSPDTLGKLTSENKTVMVDFTADWCGTCKTLEATVLNTKEVRQAVETHQVETLVADWTRGDPIITDALTAFGTRQIPVLTIFPAGRPNEPIVLFGGYTQATLLKRLEEASAAAPKGGDKATAMK